MRHGTGAGEIGSGAGTKRQLPSARSRLVRKESYVSGFAPSRVRARVTLGGFLPGCPEDQCDQCRERQDRDNHGQYDTGDRSVQLGGGVYMVDVGVGVGVMPAPHGNVVNLSLLNRGRQGEDKNRTVATPETEAARNYPSSWPALTALSTVGNRADHRIDSSSLGGRGGRCSFQQPGNHGDDHLNVTISSVAMSMIRSLHLPGIRQFRPWNRYWMATVISP